MKCNYPKESDACAFHYNGICTRDHNYECPALAMKNLSHGEMVQIAEGKKNRTPRYIDANKLIDMATHEGAYGYVDVHDIQNTPTADVVAVVRCRDCKWNGGDCSWCTKPSLVLNGEYISCLCIEPNWFCADGRRGRSPLGESTLEPNRTNFCPNCGAEMEKTDDGDKQ